MALPKPTKHWSEEEIRSLHEKCEAAMQSLQESVEVSEEYKRLLQRGKAAIIERMLQLIMNTGYFRDEGTATRYVLYWRDAPQGIAKFIQDLETVFTGVPGGGENIVASFPSATDDWSLDQIQTLYGVCEYAMQVLETNPAIASENYKQCLKRGRGVIIKAIMQLILDKQYFQMQALAFKFVMYWWDAPRALARILQHIETVFIKKESHM